MTVADRLWAAIELAYYRAAATNSAVYLEWATVREVNLNGFEIMCKRVSEPDTAFHPIGSRIALGKPSTYNFDVTSGLVPGERYCFRLREITSDMTPGEAFDLCGYGLGLTPPPTSVTVQVSIPVTLTPTVIPVQVVPGLTPAPTLAPTQDPALTLTPTLTPTQVSTFTPTPTLPGGGQPISPLPSPTVANLQQQQISPLPTPALSEEPTNANAAQVPPTEMPTATLFVTDTPFPTETPTVTPVATNTVTNTMTNTGPATGAQTGNGVVDSGVGGQPVIPNGSAGLVIVEATPTPLYVVVTATPTPQALALLPPALTPWPTAIPTASFSLDNLLVPNTQNLMVGLLCLIFLSASGLGALGLVTSVLYMRSQSRRERLPGPIYERRRY
jgi:hypothetical protein